MNTHDEPIALTVDQAVQFTGISRSQIYVAMKEGTLSARKAGRRTLFLTQDLRDYINNLPAYSVEVE